MKSTLFNMVAVLFTITLITSAGVGVVNRITEEPIARAKAAAVVEALNKVLPPFETTVTDSLTIDGLPITVYTATDAAGDVAGYAVQTATKNGFSGMIRMMVGFAPDGEVVNIDVLEQNETPGLGTKMADEDNPLLGSIRGKRLETMRLVDGRLAVVKDGGDVDALTAATISSRAYCDAVNRAWMAYRSVATGTVPTDVASGATDAASGATAASGENADHADEASGAANRTPDSVADRRGRVGDRTDIRDREAGSRIVNRNAREADGFAADKEPGARKGDGNE
ncbi:RnfABCDGE type electron transport complex subunit G [Alistipes sp. CHKCI003]|uniref:RnfABCDGE type electron transport complex subunit G n=1 Tax=Alistipes sp. CHKCI003 TaxID=1780376 RepID=UPI001CD5F12B|nr:RnfABCDGE type electron transport complex subunit G [Alistipes sp. CHKCI003]